MAIEFGCPACGMTISAPENTAGKRGTCPGCRGSIVVPAAPGGGELLDAEEANPYAASSARRTEQERRVADAFDQFSPTDDGPPRRRPAGHGGDDEEQLYEDEKECPGCGETIKRSARRCRYCGEEFAVPGGARRDSKLEASYRGKMVGAGVIWMVFGAFMICGGMGILANQNNAQFANIPKDALRFVALFCFGLAVAWGVAGLLSVCKVIAGTYIGLLFSYIMGALILFGLAGRLAGAPGGGGPAPGGAPPGAEIVINLGFLAVIACSIVLAHMAISARAKLRRQRLG